MSFLIDPPWLYANGRVLAQVAPAQTRKPPAAATLGVFLITSTYPFWLWLGLRHGQD